MKKGDLTEQYRGVQRLLKNEPLTIVMDNRGSTRGQLYEISKATQEQAERQTGDTIMFVGTAIETSKYLQGYRDCLMEIIQGKQEATKKAMKAADVAFEMIRIQGYDVKLTPQAISAINEAMPLVAKVIYPDAIIEREPAVNAIERAKQTLRDAGYILAPLFCAEDVRMYAKDNMGGIKLTEEQVADVCSFVENKSDCEIGVSWDTIRYAIEQVTEKETEN